jgi:tRNA-uridine 2-sulfurtransferase
VSATDEQNHIAAPGLAYGGGVAERLRTCTFSGPLVEADAAGEAGSLECGSLVRVELRIQAGVIQEARYQAHGCPATLASASLVCARVSGGSFLAAAAVTQEEICRDLGLAAEKQYTAGIALDALHAALTAGLRSATAQVAPPAAEAPAAEPPAGPLPGGRGVLVGMSGGVDSAVAALLLKEQGYEVVGITLTFWNDPGVADERSCCSPENVRRARRVAHSLGIPHLSLDARDDFYRDVVEYFVSEYAAGRTPNPCAKCNSRVRLGLLVDTAHRLGLPTVATGHYARLVGAPRRLARGSDGAKDQSYVLAEVAAEILEHLVFPLGGMRKPEVRLLAAQAGLEGHSAPESQEICFVPDDDHRRLLRERLGVLPGDIVDSESRALGRHEGTYNYTIGQRKGLGIAAAEPLYVIALSAAERRVVVGTAGQGLVGGVRAAGLVWHRPLGSGPFALQVRSAGAALPVAQVEVADDTLFATLARPVSGVAPGQTAVLYQDDQVVVAGTISQTANWAAAPRRSGG